jgi:hypothetical protein
MSGRLKADWWGRCMDWNLLPEGQWIVTFYFGLTRLGSPSVTEEEWSNFLAEIVTPAFMDGFTVFDGVGQYFHRQQSVIKIRSKALVVTACKENAADIDNIRREYERTFAQTAVGLTVMSGFADFGPVPVANATRPLEGAGRHPRYVAGAGASLPGSPKTSR